MPRLAVPAADLMLARFGKEEIARRAASTDHTSENVDGTLLSLTISGGNRSAYTAAQQAAADDAKAHIERMMTYAYNDVRAWIGRQELLWNEVSSATDIVVQVAYLKLFEGRLNEEQQAWRSRLQTNAKSMGKSRAIAAETVRT